MTLVLYKHVDNFPCLFHSPTAAQINERAEKNRLFAVEFTDGNLGTELCSGATDKGDVAAKAAPEHATSSLLIRETRVSQNLSR